MELWTEFQRRHNILPNNNKQAAQNIVFLNKKHIYTSFKYKIYIFSAASFWPDN